MAPPQRTLLAALLAVFFAAGMGTTQADTYTVTNTNTSGPGSLFQAILDSNSRTGQDTIAFNIPGSGVQRIDLSESFTPEITDSIIIDGYTQPGAHANSLSLGNNAVILIQLDGGSVKRNGRGLVISGSNCLVRGLSITGFQWDPSSDPFFFRVLGGFGIHLLSAGSGNVIEGNFIGLKPDGVTPTANHVGIRVEGPQSTIGGTGPAARNVISGNVSAAEILAPGGTAAFLGNYIGTDATGMKAAGNLTGLKLGTNDIVVGGTSPGSGNVISGNRYDAIDLGFSVGYRFFSSANRAAIQGNLIGTTADGITALGNGGGAIEIARGSDCMIGGLEPAAGNVIAFNGRGVAVWSGGTFGTGDSVLSNTIYGNRSRGIIHGTAQSNNGQSFPVITSETISNGAATIRGTLDSTPATEFVLQFFTDSQSLTSSKQTFLGSIGVLTDDNGHASFRATFPVSDTNVVFNGTATDSSGNTSEFSRHPAGLQNISTRASVGSGDAVLIGGFIVDHGFTVVRGIGPSLVSSGLSNVVADPTLDLRDEAGIQIKFNDNWQDDQYGAGFIQAGGLAPADNVEAAIGFFGGVRQSYTAVFRGKQNTTAVGLVEAYTDVDIGANPGTGLISGFANLSSRGFVGTGADVMIAGFIVGGGRGEDPRIVVRAIGPSLEAAGVASPVPDPLLELHDENGQLIESNDNWADTQPDDLQAVGLAPVDSMESAILARLGPGAYTAIVRGKDNTTGVALVEIYNLR
jgi:hypothetical protein